MELKNATVIVIDHGLFVEAAVRLARDFKRVLYYCPNDSDPFPKINNECIGVGLEGVEVVKSPWEHYDEIDLWFFPDVGFGAFQDWLVEQGETVWGSRSGDELELHRPFAKDVLKIVGLPVGKHKIIKGVKNLRSYLKENENVFVKVSKYRGTTESFHSPNYKNIEPHLDEMEFNLGPVKELMEFDVEEELPDRCEVGSDSYCIDGNLPSQHLAGFEVKDAGYCGAIVHAKSLPDPMKKVDSLFSNLLSTYGYRGFYSTEIRVGKDGVPFLIDPTCFDDRTEVLTRRGWKLFKDCSIDDEFATLECCSKNIEYQYPSAIIQKEYSGDMISITNRDSTIECLVTPDHDVLRNLREKDAPLFKQKASNLDQRGFIPRSGKWNGAGEAFFRLPEYTHSWEFKGPGKWKICDKSHYEPELSIPMKDWAEFLGWYLSEGSCAKWHTSISQIKHKSKVESILRRLPFSWSYHGSSFQISSKQLLRECMKFGVCNEKRVPQYIKDSSIDVIEAFLDAYCWGDGSHVDGARKYFTTSKNMADDLQELILKAGSVANIYINRTAGTKMSVNGGKEYTRNHDIYIVSESIGKTDFWFEASGKRRSQFIGKEHYSGNVYCATVPNGTLYVRRNGKPFWSGNCRMPNPPGFLYMEMYKNFSEIVWHGAHGECIDPIPAGKIGVQLQMKSSWSDGGNWQPIDFDPKYRNQIKIVNGCNLNGQFYSVPMPLGISECGSVIGFGDTAEDAIAHASKAADTVGGYSIKINAEAMDEAVNVSREAASKHNIDLGIE